jgi:hypothetical protein
VWPKDERVSRQEDYRHKAVECAEAAEAASDATERLALLEIAQAWQRLATRVSDRSQPELPLQDEATGPRSHSTPTLRTDSRS